MELRDYFKIIGRYFTFFIVITILSGVLALVFTKIQPQSYLASTTFTVNKASLIKQKDVDYYLFDHYYNVQSAGLFSQIIANWFESPSLVKEIYQEAGIPMPDVSQKKLAKTFKAVREEPATINVRISGTEKEKLEKLINAASTLIQAKTDELGKNSESFYELTKFTPIVNANNPSLFLNTIVGLILGAFIGMMLIFIIEYFKGGKS